MPVPTRGQPHVARARPCCSARRRRCRPHAGSPPPAAKSATAAGHVPPGPRGQPEEPAGSAPLEVVAGPGQRQRPLGVLGRAGHVAAGLRDRGAEDGDRRRQGALSRRRRYGAASARSASSSRAFDRVEVAGDHQQVAGEDAEHGAAPDGVVRQLPSASPAASASRRSRRIAGTARSIRRTARSMSRPARAWATASSSRSCCSNHSLARRCSTAHLVGRSASSRARSTSANRWW